MQCVYEMVHLKHIPNNLGHLTGLLDLFKAKMVGINYGTSPSCVHIVGLPVAKTTRASPTSCEIYIRLEALARKP